MVGAHDAFIDSMISMRLPQLILLNGVSSSGKTSIARLLQEELDALSI